MPYTVTERSASTGGTTLEAMVDFTGAELTVVKIAWHFIQYFINERSASTGGTTLEAMVDFTGGCSEMYELKKASHCCTYYKIQWYLLVFTSLS